MEKIKFEPQHPFSQYGSFAYQRTMNDVKEGRKMTKLKMFSKLTESEKEKLSQTTTNILDSYEWHHSPTGTREFFFTDDDIFTIKRKLADSISTQKDIPKYLNETEKELYKKNWKQLQKDLRTREFGYSLSDIKHYLNSINKEPYELPLDDKTSNLRRTFYNKVSEYKPVKEKIKKQFPEIYDRLLNIDSIKYKGFDPYGLHRAIIEQAIKEGKTIPYEVLEDYPDLMKFSKQFNLGGNINSLHSSLGTAKELDITPTIKDHDMIAECGDCRDKFSYQRSKNHILWECPECKSIKRIS